MRVNGNENAYNQAGKTQTSDNVNQGKSNKAGAASNQPPQGVDTTDKYIPSQPSETDSKSAVYSKPDQSTIAKLKAQSEQTYSHLREMVRQMLERQGMTFKDLEGFDGEIIVDEQTRTEAAAAIADGGAFSAEAVSDRIVEFAKAISGGDKSKIDTLMSAIDKGFSEASKALGGQLPDISSKTYELIKQKMDAWINE